VLIIDQTGSLAIVWMRELLERNPVERLLRQAHQRAVRVVHHQNALLVVTVEDADVRPAENGVEVVQFVSGSFCAREFPHGLLCFRVQVFRGRRGARKPIFAPSMLHVRLLIAAGEIIACIENKRSVLIEGEEAQNCSTRCKWTIDGRGNQSSHVRAA
jgi:hypothetical protein